MIVVSDTSPLTALLAVGEAELLPRLFHEVIIPDFNLGKGAKKIEAYDAFMNEVVPAFR